MYLSSALSQALCLLSAFRRSVFHPPPVTRPVLRVRFRRVLYIRFSAVGASRGADVTQEVHCVCRRGAVSCLYTALWSEMAFTGGQQCRRINARRGSPPSAQRRSSERCAAMAALAQTQGLDCGIGSPGQVGRIYPRPDRGRRGNANPLHLSATKLCMPLSLSISHIPVK